MNVLANVTLDLQRPGYNMIYAVQGDKLSRQVTAKLVNAGLPWSVPAGALMTIRFYKPDGTAGYYDTDENGDTAYTISGSTVTFTVAQQALAVVGNVAMQLNFYTASGEALSSFAFIVCVQPNVYSDEAILSEDYYNVLIGLMTDFAQEITNLDNALRAGYGAPLKAATAAAMTDHAKIYVYTGSETGYTSGHWYYYNGTAWTDGGVYNAVSFTTDTTLSVSGMAADAKATGDAIGDVKSALAAVENITETPMPTTWEQGSINGSGVNSVAANRGRCDYIYVPAGSILKIHHGSYRWLGKIYNEDKTYSGEFGSWQSTDYSVPVSDTNYYYRFVVRAANDSTIVADNIDTTFTSQTALYLKLEELEDNADTFNQNVENIQKELDVEMIDVATTWAMGSINTATGAETVASTRARSDYVFVPKGSRLYFEVGNYYSRWVRYDTNKSYLGTSNFEADWAHDDYIISPIGYDCYYRFIVCNASDTTTDVVIANINCAIAELTGFSVTMEKLIPIAYPEMQFVLPSKVQICGGIQQNFYYQNLLQYGNVETIPLIKSTNYLDDYSYFSRYNAAANGNGTNGLYFQAFLHDTKNVSLQSSVLQMHYFPSSVGNGLDKTVLIIGDSLTEQHDAIASDLVTMFSEDVMNVTLIGTQGSGSAKHEGRSGWSAEIYTSQATYDGKTNPFWNSSTQEFDFTYYMTQNSYSSVDYVFIDLGSNSIDSTSADIITAYNTIIDSIHDYDSAIRIGVWLPPVRAVSIKRALQRGNQSLNVNKTLIDTFDGMENSKIYLVPVYFNLDPYYDYKIVERQVSARNTMTLELVEDLLHPALVGFQKLADMIYSYIKYFGSLDA